jgi:hypothetical protein
MIVQDISVLILLVLQEVWYGWGYNICCLISVGGEYKSKGNLKLALFWFSAIIFYFCQAAKVPYLLEFVSVSASLTTLMIL